MFKMEHGKNKTIIKFVLNNLRNRMLIKFNPLLKLIKSNRLTNRITIKENLIFH